MNETATRTSSQGPALHFNYYEISRNPAHTVIELASARQHQEKNWPTIMERAVEGITPPNAARAAAQKSAQNPVFFATRSHKPVFCASRSHFLWGWGRPNCFFRPCGRKRTRRRTHTKKKPTRANRHENRETTAMTAGAPSSSPREHDRATGSLQRRPSASPLKREARRIIDLGGCWPPGKHEWHKPPHTRFHGNA